MGKNHRLLEDAHVHLLAYLQFNLGRSTPCLDYLSLVLKHMNDPSKTLPKDEGTEKVVEQTRQECAEQTRQMFKNMDRTIPWMMNKPPILLRVLEYLQADQEGMISYLHQQSFMLFRSDERVCLFSIRRFMSREYGTGRSNLPSCTNHHESIQLWKSDASIQDKNRGKLEKLGYI
ncbi:unnamed protein product [Lactuca virosa]|uniref:Uncharacterized protein n=1 Tax=Lactuca virosa TaxID=75947 RepID=A0AAU9PAP9_9ASTR|nr:unnamed protein product [Lactuca virosa]